MYTMHIACIHILTNKFDEIQFMKTNFDIKMFFMVLQNYAIIFFSVKFLMPIQGRVIESIQPFYE